MLLSDLLRESGEDAVFPRDPNITGLCHDSRLAGTGSLFFCLCGARFDGHLFAPDAYRNGCRQFVAERPLGLPDDAQVLTVPDARRALAAFSAAFYGHPARQMRLVAVTGTKGKTTTALMAAGILNACGIPCGYIGTNGIEYAGKSFPTVNTTPESLELHRHMREMLDLGVRVLVMEVSSQAILQKRVEGLTFECAAMMNLSPDHIGPGEHRDFAEYSACKHAILADYGAKYLFCGDSPEVRALIADLYGTGRGIALFGTDPDCALRAAEITHFREGGAMGVRFLAQTDDESAAVELPIPGIFNVQNALAAMAIGTTFGLPIPVMAEKLAFLHPAGRFETVRLPTCPGATVVIDYAHNGASLSSALAVLRAYNPRRLICLFGSVGERTQIRRGELGRAAAHGADHAVLTSDNPGGEPPMQILSEIAAAIDAEPDPVCSYEIIPDRAEAIRHAVTLLRDGDVLLLAGKGHEKYQYIRGEYLPFEERKILEEIPSPASFR